MDVARQCLRTQQPSAGDVAETVALSPEQDAHLRAALSQSLPFAVCAARQVRGRGTAGRTWDSPTGNMFCTFVLPLADAGAAGAVPSSLLPVLPLLFGLAARQALISTFPGLPASSVMCKWPNDILLGEKKVGGVLIEGDGAFVMAGVGLNLVLAPPVQDGGRPSTSVSDFLAAAAAADSSNTGQQPTAVDPGVVAAALFDHLLALLARYTTPEMGSDEARRQAVVAAFEAVMNRRAAVFRRLPNGQRSEEPLQPLGLTSWGLLKVRHTSGEEEELVAEYLY